MRLSRGLSLAVPLLFFLGCHHQPSIPVVNTPIPASTIALEAAKREFAAGDYASAAVDFQRYLQLAPTDGEVDYALFQLGTIYSVPDGGRQDWVRATSYYNRLVSEFPQSSLKPAAQLILSAREQSVQLSATIARLNTETAQLQAASAEQISLMAKLRADAEQQSEQIGKLKADVDQRDQEIQRREGLIREAKMEIDRLKTQLDRLIRIDSERRPRP